MTVRADSPVPHAAPESVRESAPEPVRESAAAFAVALAVAGEPAR
ncbi:hypothetical protein ACIOWG_21815 [Streptomyces sp. NPDC087658]